MSEDDLRTLIDECAALARQAAFAHAINHHPAWADLPDDHRRYWRSLVAPVIDHVLAVARDRG